MPLIPPAAGLAAAQAIGIVAVREVDLRWPNDLLIGDRKAGGILVESKTEAGTLSFAVVGIGINVHQRSFDPNLSTPATSLEIEAKRSISRQALLISLLESLQHETWALQDPGLRAAITARVTYMSSWVSNRSVEVHGPQACIGVTAGLDEHGFLLVRTDKGLVTVQTGGIRDASAKEDNAPGS
jgi:BirA family transcriptional regulator, biotin operon repressor / biotin---[acetyl-CoA-carboxylase] ligase